MIMIFTTRFPIVGTLKIQIKQPVFGLYRSDDDDDDDDDDDNDHHDDNNDDDDDLNVSDQECFEKTL